ncbi:MAG: YceD family protein [Gammaproteobacteria bacterium]
MSERLPDFVDPLLMVEKGREFEGLVPLKLMDRLKNVIQSSDGNVKVKVSFFKDGKIAAAKGRVEVNVVLECQNCLENFDWHIDSAFNLGIVASLDEAEALPELYEPLLATDKKIRFIDIIEEEILLSIPSIPKHPGGCSVIRPGRGVDEFKGESKSPFSILKTLKNTGVK